MAPEQEPGDRGGAASDNVLWIKALDDVSGKLFALARQANGTWARQAMPLPANSTIQIAATAGKQDMAFATVEGMLTPTTLVAVNSIRQVRQVAALPAQFDASQFTVDQRFARSKDGTRVPYFLVRRKGAAKPTGALIHAYGGFRNAQTPTYLTGQPYRSGPLGLFWVEDGGAFVLANIRGGGEYGPAWHKARCARSGRTASTISTRSPSDLVRTGVSPKGKHRHFRPLQRRRAGRGGDDPASRLVWRGHLGVAACST